MKQAKVFTRNAGTRLSFYMTMPGSASGAIYLFSTRSYSGLRRYFAQPKSEAEIRSFSAWDKNPLLDKIICRLPKYIRYAKKYELADEYAA